MGGVHLSMTCICALEKFTRVWERNCCSSLVYLPNSDYSLSVIDPIGKNMSLADKCNGTWIYSGGFHNIVHFFRAYVNYLANWNSDTYRRRWVICWLSRIKVRLIGQFSHIYELVPIETWAILQLGCWEPAGSIERYYNVHLKLHRYRVRVETSCTSSWG